MDKEIHQNFDCLPDIRDGLTHQERVILYTLSELQREYPHRHIPTIMLYGRVVEKLNISQAAFQSMLNKLIGRHFR